MAALVNALVSDTAFKSNDLQPCDIQVGENGHAEYSWAKYSCCNSLREKILQFSFQTTRTHAEGIERMSGILRKILTEIQYGLKSGMLCPGEHQELLITAYKIIGHTRDIIDGKGEYAHAYMQILVWCEFYPQLAMFALQKFVTFEENGHPYGSWKDIKYFCNYCKNKGLSLDHPLMQYAFQLLNSQIFYDSTAENKTLAAKWVPREKCKKFGWIFEHLAYSFFNHYLTTAKTKEALSRAQKKCKMEYRKMCSSMNKVLATTQILQCANQWADIDHSKTTSITISKQKKAFLNVKADGSQRTHLVDRILCSQNFRLHINKAVAGRGEMKGKRVGLNNFTVQAFDLIHRRQKQQYNETNETDVYMLQTEIDLLNSQWCDNSSQTSSLCEMIPMCDFSGSMTGDPMNCALALGIRVAEKSLLGKRVLSFSTNPTWHNLDGATTFVDMVEILQRGEVGLSTNFHKAMKVILDAIIEKKLTPEQVSGLVLAVFSDMQIDQAEGGSRFNSVTLYDSITKMYEDAGNRLYGKPFKSPHILFWNLRSTDGFPCLSSQKNVSMMSGFSPALLSMFCEKGLNALQSTTPWMGLLESMNKPRYQCLEDKVKEVVL